MKGKLGYDKWSVSSMGSQDFIAERIIDGKSEQQHVHSHCLACAKTDILAKYGGQVDTRGWQNQGTCGSFLKAIAEGVKNEQGPRLP